MTNDRASQFGMHRCRSNARGHGSGPANATWSRRGVRTRETRSFIIVIIIIIIIIIIILEGMPSRAAHARRILISVPMRPITYRAG